MKRGRFVTEVDVPPQGDTMRKPVSKHALRRALERVMEEGRIHLEDPTGAVVDRLWHEIEKEMYGADAKKPTRQPASA
jgi:hypothetical protein